MASPSLLCTTRFDPHLESFKWNNAPDGSPCPYLLLHYQLDRLLLYAPHLSLDYASLRRICDDVVHSVNGADNRAPLRVRVVVPPSGNITATASPAEPLRYDPTASSQFNPTADTQTESGPALATCLDTQPTSGTVPMKTTFRQPYDEARARVGIPPLGAPRTSQHPDDVILFNASGAIMESSICNVAFYREGKWLTPPLSVGCISGVFRRWLLENNRIHEADECLLSLDSIKDDEWVLLFNGVMGCRLGKVHRARSAETSA